MNTRIAVATANTKIKQKSNEVAQSRDCTETVEARAPSAGAAVQKLKPHWMIKIAKFFHTLTSCILIEEHQKFCHE